MYSSSIIILTITTNIACFPASNKHIIRILFTLTFTRPIIAPYVIIDANNYNNQKREFATRWKYLSNRCKKNKFMYNFVSFWKISEYLRYLIQYTLIYPCVCTLGLHNNLETTYDDCNLELLFQNFLLQTIFCYIH